METKRIVVSQISSHKKEPEFVSERVIQNKNLFIVFMYLLDKKAQQWLISLRRWKNRMH